VTFVRPPAALLEFAGEFLSFEVAPTIFAVNSTVEVALSFRAAALSALHAITGKKDSFLLSGHGSDGQPDKRHEHAYFLPQPNEAGFISQIVVMSPVYKLDDAEREALLLVRTIVPKKGERPLSVMPAERSNRGLVVSSRWESLTPYVPLRFHTRGHGKRHLSNELQLASEIESRLLATSVRSLNVRPAGKVPVRLGRRLIRDTTVRRSCHRPSFIVTLETSLPVCGPLLLGHSCHYGLGHFRPQED
jgi:CRISPR-associated protein Csb2